MTPTAGRRYRILGTIGKGGFGTVYKAELFGEGDFTKVVALKVLNPDAALVDEVAQRLRDEARILGLVRHRAIVQVDGLVRFDNQWTIVMEYLEGIDLREAISGGPMPAGAALEVVGEVASALHQAWIQPGPDGTPLEMLHRDIKPSNVVVTAAGEVKVLDFGTARANFSAREAKTQSMAFGTLDFMSPERLEFEDVPAGDVYATGCLLFELVTGQAVGRTSPDPAKHRVVHERATDTLAQMALDDELCRLILDCLDFDHTRRPTADQVSRQCRHLRSKGQDMWLADWARVEVPPRIQNRGAMKKDGMTGVVLIESTGTRMKAPPATDRPDTVWVRTPHPAEPRESADSGDSGDSAEPIAPAAAPAPVISGPVAAPSQPIPTQASSSLRSIVVVAIVLSVVGLLGLAAAGGAIWYVTAEPELAEVDEIVDAPTPAPDEDPEPEPADEAEPEPSAEPKPKPPAAPSPRPKQKPRATAKVQVSGDATSVALISGSGDRFGPGSLPPGHYTIEATFEKLGTVRAGKLDIAAGQTAALKCSGMFGRCDVSVK